MVAGNITNFPKRETQSDTMVCNQATSSTDGAKVTVTGQIMTGGEASADFTMTLEAQDEHKMAFNAKTVSAKDATDSNNYFSMSYHSPVDEEIYGMGLQYSEWDFKGKSVPLISTEAGVGRGIEPITSVQNKFMGGQGGTPTTSYAPAAQYITNKQRGFIFDQNAIGIAMFDGNQQTEMLYWHEDEISGTMLWGEDPMSLS